MDPFYILTKTTITSIVEDGGAGESDEAREEFDILKPEAGPECPQTAGMTYGSDRHKTEVLCVFKQEHMRFLDFICPLLLTDQGSCGGAEVLASMISTLQAKGYDKKWSFAECACEAMKEAKLAFADDLIKILDRADEANSVFAPKDHYRQELEEIIEHGTFQVAGYYASKKS